MNNYRRNLAAIGLSALITFCLGFSTSAQGQTTDKPFEKWSKDEVNKILTDSLWAKTQTLRIQRRGQVRSIAGQTESVVGDRTGALGSADAPLDYKFTIRLHSAAPIRQALVRKEQLKWNYEKRSAAEQKAFDLQARQVLLDCSICADHYVVSVGFSSNNSSGNDLVYQWFGASTVPSLKGYIYLANERGERRDLIDFIPPKSPGDDVFFIFPRLDDKGQPLFTATDKKLIFRMSDNNARSITNFSMDISKLMVDGKAQF